HDRHNDADRRCREACEGHGAAPSHNGLVLRNVSSLRRGSRRLSSGISTAPMMTIAVTLCWYAVGKLRRITAFCIIAIIRTPQTTCDVRPCPPARGMPPIAQAAIVSNARLGHSSGCPEATLLVKITAAIAQNPAAAR